MQRSDDNANLFIVESPLEKTKERRQTEAIHVVDLTQITDDKEQLASLLSQRQISIPLLQQSNTQLQLIDPN